jgi:Flp pilus assembly protein protease CpaA
MAWWAGGLVALLATGPDLRHHEIPWWITIPGAAAALGAAALGYLPGAALLWGVGVGVLYTVLTPADAFGGGDLQLAAVTAAWWGPAAVLCLLGSHLLQVGYTVAANRRHRRAAGTPVPLPWAPFLAAAWLALSIVMVVGEGR